MQTALNDIIKTVDECCEKTIKMIDKAPGESKRANKKNDLIDKSLESNKEKFNKVQRVHDLLNEEGFGKDIANIDEVKLDFGDISGIKGEN